MLWVGGVVAVAFLVLRCLRCPEQPWPKWLLPVGVVAAAALGLAGFAWGVIAVVVMTVGAATWDSFWRLGHDVDVFW